MSKLLARLARAEKLTMNEINDLVYMKYQIDKWLDNGLITDDEYDLLHEELGL